MKMIVATLTTLAALVLSSHALAASYGTSATKEIKENIAKSDYKSITIDGIQYVVTITTLDTGGQGLYVIKKKGGSYNVVTNTKLPIYGAGDAIYDIKNNILSVTYGYAHNGSYETTLKFELSSWSSPTNLDSLLISVTTLVSGPADSGADDSESGLDSFTKISEFNFISNKLKIWSGTCTSALQHLPSTENVNNLACPPTYEVRMPNDIKYSLKSINIDDLMNWTGFVADFVEMNCMKNIRRMRGRAHG